jgi:GalNAc-alpha-(1->4)-GalNAc-alpha-(1->3)-diNAcBac-PP-undecaprenol alpha-1,4-N-acetyl-D-galactosaminyltransferase
VVNLTRNINNDYEVHIILFIDEVDYIISDDIAAVHVLNRTSMLGLFFQYVRTLRVIKADYCWSFMTQYSIFSIIAKCFVKTTKFIVSDRNNVKRLYGKHVRLLRRLAYPFADKIVYQTHSERENDYRFNVESCVVNNFIDSRYSHGYVKPIFSYQLVSVGRIVPQKNHISVLRVLALRDDCHKWTYTIFGSGFAKASLVQEAAVLGVELVINDPVENLYDRLDDFDCFIFPSLYEGYPNALAEASSFGIPILSANFKFGALDILDNDRCVYTSESTLTNALEALIVDKLSFVSSRSVLSHNERISNEIRGMLNEL